MMLRALRSSCRAYVRYAPCTLGKISLVMKLDPALRDQPVIATARTCFGATFSVDTSDIIQRFLYQFGVWEPHMTAWVSRVLRPGDAFVDVGANIGYYTLLAARLVGPTGRVVAVEPSLQFRQVMADAIKNAGHRNIRVVGFAAADVSRQATFWLEDPANLGGTTMFRPRSGTPAFTAEARPLAEILTTEDVSRARVIKIDAEGAEAQVIEGLIPLLSILRPDAEISVEVTPWALARQGRTPEDALGPLLAVGFHVYKIPNDYTAASYPAAICRPQPPRRWDGPITEMSDLVLSRTDAQQLS